MSGHIYRYPGHASAAYKINGVKEYKVHTITKKTALPIYLLTTLSSFGGSNNFAIIVFSVINKA